MRSRPDLSGAIQLTSALGFAITKQMMAAKEFGEVGQLIETAQREGRIDKLVGRIILTFPEFDETPGEVYEDPLCRPWFEALEATYQFAAILLEPKRTLPMFMLSQVTWSKQRGKVVPSEEESLQFLLDRGMTAFAFARWLDVDPREFTTQFLTSVGLGSIINPDLLDDFERVADSELVPDTDGAPARDA